jgi:CHAT domain-containing protein
MRRPIPPARLGLARLPFALLALAGLSLLSACETPPPDAYVSGGPIGEGVLVGRNSVGDPCLQYKVAQGGGDIYGGDIYCGAWNQPAARIRVAPDAAPPAQQAARLAASLAPRITDCGSAEPVRVAGAEQAVQMACARGRWPHAALVVQAGSRVYYADGMVSAVPSMQRAIAVLAGRAQPLPPEEGVRRTSGRRPDPNDFQGLMQAGFAANREGFSEEAATYFRSAVQLMDRAGRQDNWGLLYARVALGIQLSNQGKSAEADALFDRAGQPALLQSSPLSTAVYEHYKGLHLLNRGVQRGNTDDLREAIRLVQSAEARYLDQAPASSEDASGTDLLTRFAPTTQLSQLHLGGRFQAAAPNALEASMGVIESRRNQAIMLQSLGDHEAALAMAASAEDFARARGLTLPKVAAFFYRTTGIVMLESGRVDPSVFKLGQSIQAFRAGWATTPTPKQATTQLRRAEALLKAGDASGTFDACREATQTLVTLRQSVERELLQPCLVAYSRRLPSASDPQALLRDMFLTAQLSRASATAELAQKAALRLAADPRIARELAIRDNANADLNDLRERRARTGGSAAEAAALDRQIAEAEAALRQTETDLQDALPNYHALLEPFSTADDVFKALRPGEAFAVINLADTDGWTFLLRDGRIRLGRIEGGDRRMGDLVSRLRASIEPTGSALPRYDAETAHALYAAVLGGVEDGMAGAAELSVAPVGKLLSIPFEVMLTAPFAGENLGEAPFLVRRFPVTHVPSAANLVRLRQRIELKQSPAGTAVAAAPTRPWFGFGASVPITPAVAGRLFPASRCGESESASLLTRLPVLPGAVRELTAVRSLLRGSAADEVQGAAFTRQAALARPLSNYRVLHFAAHALLQSDISCLDEPSIVTTVTPNDPRPALLSATDILTGMKLGADVVVLSACNTGGGSGRDGGESLSGLAKSFFFAGARALMVSHWSVDDQTNVRLVVEALDGMNDSPTGALSPALRKTQLRMLGTPGYEHPFFWAPMIVLGEGGGRLAPAGSASAVRSAGL